MIDLSDFFNYIGLDEPDKMNKHNARLALETAEAYIKGVVGSDIDILLSNAPQYRTAMKMYAKAIFEQKDNIEQEKGFAALIWQLQQKYNKAKRMSGDV